MINLLIDKYFDGVISLLNKVREAEKENILKAAELVKEALKNDKLVHVYGTGHSQVLAIEVFYRAGGLVPINAILDIGSSVYGGAMKSTGVERLQGYAKILLDYYDIGNGDVLIIVSNSGRNSLPIEMAMGARERGSKVVAVTSIEFSSKFPSRHPSGKRLYEVADVVIDNHVPPGDALLEVEGIKTKVAPVSTIINSAILHSIMVEAAKMLVEEGIEPPVWLSANVPGGDEYNKKYIEKYKYRIKHL
ncbi:MAG: sugar isomerase domain-containing protein [Candidatus Njordarchaeales archaeon]